MAEGTGRDTIGEIRAACPAPGDESQALDTNVPSEREAGLGHKAELSSG